MRSPLPVTANRLALSRLALSRLAVASVLTALLLVPTDRAQADTAVPITRISFAGAGGDFTHRYGTFVVPDQNTTVPAYGGALRRYDVHIAKMIEIAHFQWCQSDPKYQGVVYNYDAANGAVFMGQIYISCALARKAVQQFGLGRPERTIIENRGNPATVMIPVLDLNGKKIAQFQALVRSLRPQCVAKLCPGDHNPR